jgi:hypothetical protein
VSIAADNKAIKIPDKHYVGFQKRGEDEIPLGFMTPDGEDQAAVKRKATVDSWASGGYYARQNVAIPAQSFENKPMLGFKMGRNVKHGYGWGQGNVKWRIEDPRGFELEISSPNFAQIISLCVLEQGEIQEKCVWGRLGNENILIPVNSDVYKAAEANTARLNKSASLRDLNIGDFAVMQNGVEGTFMGAFFPIESSGHSFTFETKKRSFFAVKDDDGVITRFEVIASPKLSEIRPAGLTITIDEAEKQVNEALKAAEARNGYSSVLAVSTKAVKNTAQTLTITRVADYAEGRLRTLDVKNTRWTLICRNPVDDRWGMAQGDWYIRGNTVQLDQIDHAKFLADNTIKCVTEPQRGYYGYSSHHSTVRFEVDASDTSLEWYILEGTISTNNGYVVTRQF